MITLSSVGPGFGLPVVHVNLRPLTYAGYEALGGNLDQEFPSRPTAAAEGEIVYRDHVMTYNVNNFSLCIYVLILHQ